MVSVEEYEEMIKEYDAQFKKDENTPQPVNENIRKK